VKLIRGLAGVLLWIVSALLGLVAVVLCVTVILLPVGLPLLAYAGRLFTLSLDLVLPRAVSHPFQAAEKSAQKGDRKMKKTEHKRGQGTVQRVRERVPLAS
jgi:hypothetical protein